MPLVDLSHPLVTGMPVYPGDPEVLVAPALSVESDGVAVARLGLGSHSGTHLDAPAHSVAGGRTVDRIPLELLADEARVLRAHVGPGERIGAEQITGDVPQRLPAIVCVATGWDRHFRDAEALRHPFLDPDFAQELWARGARVLGVDMLSPDPTELPDGSEPDGTPVHAFWLGGDGVIVENLARLGDIPDVVEMTLLPLRLEDGDGSPIRAVARFA